MYVLNLHLPIKNGEFSQAHTIRMPMPIDCGGVDLVMVGQNHREYKMKFSFLGGDQLCTYNAETQEYDVGCIFVVGLGASKYPNLPLFRGQMKVPTEFTVTCTPIDNDSNNSSDKSILLALKFLPPLANQIEKHQRVHTVTFQ